MIIVNIVPKERNSIPYEFAITEHPTLPRGILIIYFSGGSLCDEIAWQNLWSCHSGFQEATKSNKFSSNGCIFQAAKCVIERRTSLVCWYSSV